MVLQKYFFSFRRIVKKVLSLILRLNKLYEFLIINLEGNLGGARP